MDEEEVPQQHLQAHAIAVRPPPFSAKRVPSWFAVLEAQCANSNVVSSIAKFRHVIANIPLEVCDKLTEDDLSSNNYDSIKGKIISLYSRSDPQILNEFLNVPSTLNCKPTLYLQQLRNSSTSWNLPEGFLKTYFLNAMPTNIRPNLITHNGSLDEIATLADNLLDYSYPNPNFIANNQFNPVSNINYSNRNNYSQDRTYPSSVQPHAHSNSSHSRYSHPGSMQSYASFNIPFGVRAFNDKQKPKVCRFHLYYGQSANKCKPWCILNSPSVTTLPNSRPNSRSSSPLRNSSSEN